MNPQDYNDVDIDYSFDINDYDSLQSKVFTNDEKEISTNENLSYGDKLTTTIDDFNNMKPTREIIRGSVINE